MLIKMICPQCGSQMQIDSSNQIIECMFCGCKIANMAQRVEVNQNINQTVRHITDRTNEPNLYIDYRTTDPEVVMIVRIVSTGQKMTYLNGQSMSYHLPQGLQKIVLKIGRTNYDREIYIPEDNSPVRINASYSGRANIYIDQPNYSLPQGQGVQREQLNTQPPYSALAILSFIASMTMIGGPVGVVLALIDLINKDKTKRHGLAIAGLVIGCVCILAIIAGIFGEE